MARVLALALLTVSLAAFGSQQVINIGSAPNDGTGDPGRVAFQKVNANFTELYASSVVSPNVDNTGATNVTAALATYLATTQNAYFLPGTYQVCGLMVPGTGALYFHGSGLATKFITSPSCNQPAIQITCSGTAPVIFADFLIDGNSSNQAQDGSVPAHGLYILSCPTLQVHNIRIQNVAGHGLFTSNPASPSTAYSAQLYADIDLFNIGVARGGTYGSAFDITNAYYSKVSNVNVDTTAKAAFRISGVGVNISNSTARNYGNGGVVPVSSVDTDINIVGGAFINSAAYSNASITGSTHTAVGIDTFSGNALTTGWSAGDLITDSAGDIPAGTYLASVAAGGLSATLSQAATGSHAGDTFTVNAAVDGIRILGNRTSVTGAIICGNQGNGISFLNGATNATAMGNLICNNGQGPAAVGPLDGRSGIKIYNSGSASTDITVVGNRFYDDQGSPTQLYAVEVANSSDRVNICSNSIGTEKNGALGITTSGASIEVCNDNLGLTSKFHDTATHTLTGTTTETSLSSFIITGKEMAKTAELSCRANGTLAGVAGTKTLKFYFGGSLGDGSGLTMAALAASAPNWSTDILVSMNSSYTAEKASVGTSSSTASASTTSPSADTTNNFTVQISGTLTNAADSITLSSFSCYRRR